MKPLIAYAIVDKLKPQIRVSDIYSPKDTDGVMLLKNEKLIKVVITPLKK